MNSELKKLRKITETLTSNGFLIDQTKEWEHAFDAVSDCIFVVNPLFIVKFVNRLLLDRLGVKSREEVIGAVCHKMLGFDQPILPMCEEHKDIEVCESCVNDGECIEKDGDTCNFGEHMIPILDGVFEFKRSSIKSTSGKLLGYICVLRDVTESRMIHKSAQHLLKLYTLDCPNDEKLAQFILEKIVDLTDSEVGYLHFVDDKGNGDVSLDLFIWSKDTMKNCNAAPAHHYPLDKAGIWADAVRQRKPIIHNDYPTAPGRKGLPDGHFPLKRHMSVPIFDNGKVVAVAGVGNKKIPYSQLDINYTTVTLNSMWSVMKRKAAERELIESELSISELTRLTKTAIYEIDFQANSFTFVNDAMCEHTGYTREELLALGPADLLTESAQVKWMERFAAFDRGEILPNTVEYEAKVKDGSYVWVLCSTDFKLNDDGKIIGARVVAIDVTRQRVVENEVRDILEASPFGVHMYKFVDDELIFAAANDASDNILRVDNKIYYGKELTKAFPSLTESVIPEKYMQVMKTGKTWSATVDYKDEFINGSFEVHAFKTSEASMAAMFRLTGEEQLLQDRVAELSDKLKDAEYECRTLADYLVQEKIVDKPLSVNEHRFKRLFQTSSTSMGVISLPEHIIIWANAAMCKMSGYDESELIGQSVSIVHNDIASYERVARVIEEDVAEKGIATVAFDIYNKKGEVVNIIFNGTLLNGATNRLSFSFININENYKRIE